MQSPDAPPLCPHARATTALEQTTKEPYLLATGCRRWDCPQCAALKKAILVRRIVDAAPDRFITLTVRHDDSKEHRLTELKTGLAKLTRHLRKSHPFEFLRMLESCQDGYPHFHLLARCPFIPWRDLRDLWRRFTTATIVDIRKAHGKSAAYVAKYIQKARDENGRFGRQRISVTRNFWRPSDSLQELLAFQNHLVHPTVYAWNRRETTAFTTKGPTRWHMADRQPGDDLPPELEPEEPRSCTF